MKAKKLTLDKTHPELCKEWDFERNWNELGLRPGDVTFGMHVKVYWICQEFPEEGWLMSLNTKTSAGCKCPFCYGDRVNIRNCLFTTHPELCYEWDYERNLKEFNLTPFNITYGSTKKVYWICSKFPKEDKWLVSPHQRTNQGDNCPFCSGRGINNRNCLQTVRPDIAAQWHPDLNGGLKPMDFTEFSNQEIWWQCSDHVEDFWKATVADRSRDASNCPFCSGTKINLRNCLATTHPELAREWHPTLNGNLTPGDITFGSNKFIKWKCDLGHDFKASPNQRTNMESGCTYCFNKNQTLVFNYLINNNFNFKREFKVKSFYDNNYHISKVDFYLIDYNLFIEYDGEQHFKPTRFKGVSWEQAEINFQKQQFRDQALDQYCLCNYINILHIDGRKYQGHKLQQYLETEFQQYLTTLLSISI